MQEIKVYCDKCGRECKDDEIRKIYPHMVRREGQYLRNGERIRLEAGTDDGSPELCAECLDLLDKWLMGVPIIELTPEQIEKEMKRQVTKISGGGATVDYPRKDPAEMDDDELNAYIVKLRDAGWSLEAIGSRIGRSGQTVSNRLKKVGYQ